MDGFFGSSGGGSNTQLLVMPTASKSFFDSKIIIQYKGTTTENYINGYFYKCIDTDGVYSWQQTYVQPDGVATVVKGVWTATGQTDYSTVPLPATKGWAYLVNGSATIDERIYTSGDLIVFNKDVASGTTVVTADLDFMDMDMVTKDNTIALTNKTINVDNNTLSNIEVDNFKTGVVQTTVRAVGVATDTAMATEKAVSTSLEAKQDTLPSASNTVEGKVRFATDAEATTGTSEVLAVNPKQLKTGLDGINEIFDIVYESERTTKTGRAGLFSDTVNPLAKADIPLAYAKALDGYNNAKTEQSDAATTTDDISSFSSFIQYADSKIYFTNKNYSTPQLMSSENLDLSSPSVVFELTGLGDSPFIGTNINIIIHRAGTNGDSKLRIYDKSWTLLQEYNDTYGLHYDSGGFICKYYQYGTNIYITTLLGVIVIADNATSYTPVFHNLGKCIHSLAYFKSNWYFGYTNDLGAYEENYYSQSATLDSLGTTLFIRNNIQYGERPYITHNDDYIVCQYIRDSSVTGSNNEHTGISNDGSNWNYYDWYDTVIPNYIFFKGTTNNRFIVYGAKIGITTTSNPLTWTGKTTTQTYFNAPLQNIALYSPNGIAFARDGKYIYSTSSKKIYTDTIEGIDIEYYQTPTGQKICLPSQNTALANLYAITGDNSYLVLDTSGETLQLYRRNEGYGYMIVDADYICPLTNDVSQERFAKLSDINTKTLFTQTADNTEDGNNIDTEFSLLNTGVGSLTILKDSLSVGKKISLRGWGIVSGVNGTATTINVKLGSTVIATNTSNLPTALSDIKFDIEIDIDVKSTGITGTVICGGKTLIYSSVGFGTLTARNFYSALPVEIDTTSDLVIGLTYQFGAASESNSILLKDLSVVSYN